jgi:transcriptional regulator with XRE-family HTH domain
VIYLTTFAVRFKLLRSLHNLSAENYQELGISRRMVFSYENAPSNPTLEKLLTLANYFCCSLDYLVGRSDSPEYEKYIPSAEEIFFNHPNTSKDLVNKYKHDKTTHPIELAPVFLRNYESIRDNDNQK